MTELDRLKADLKTVQQRYAARQRQLVRLQAESAQDDRRLADITARLALLILQAIGKGGPQ